LAMILYDTARVLLMEGYLVPSALAMQLPRFQAVSRLYRNSMNCHVEAFSRSKLCDACQDQLRGSTAGTGRNTFVDCCKSRFALSFSPSRTTFQLSLSLFLLSHLITPWLSKISSARGPSRVFVQVVASTNQDPRRLLLVQHLQTQAARPSARKMVLVIRIHRRLAMTETV